jgi:hypothetical protein
MPPDRRRFIVIQSRYHLDRVKLFSQARDRMLGSFGAISQQEHSMGIVMVKCPGTGRAIATGIVADRASFNATPVFFARVYCPMCASEHEWFAKEAWVCDSEPCAPPLCAA